ncbi:MAG: GNAT family N-acetyltransferase [Streptosporangiaceae bacterium]
MDVAAALAAYNAQVRRNLSDDGTGAVIERDGPVVRRVAPAGHDDSCVLWSDLDDGSADAAIAAQVALFADRNEPFEWKLYSYDRPADLGDRLRRAGLVPEEPESLMIGEPAEVLAALSEPAPPPGVSLRVVTGRAGVATLCEVHDKVFGTDGSALALMLADQQHRAPDMAVLVVAESGGEAVCAGRIEFVPDSEFAGLWGGGTVAAWRGRGIYRALVRFRAELAAECGTRYLTVDASHQSRPVLERAGFVRAAVTTPFEWRP